MNSDLNGCISNCKDYPKFDRFMVTFCKSIYCRRKMSKMIYCFLGICDIYADVFILSFSLIILGGNNMFSKIKLSFGKINHKLFLSLLVYHTAKEKSTIILKILFTFYTFCAKICLWKELSWLFNIMERIFQVFRFSQKKEQFKVKLKKF